jgi:hypothetical protein
MKVQLRAGATDRFLLIAFLPTFTALTQQSADTGYIECDEGEPCGNQSSCVILAEAVAVA